MYQSLSIPACERRKDSYRRCMSWSFGKAGEVLFASSAATASSLFAKPKVAVILTERSADAEAGPLKDVHMRWTASTSSLGTSNDERREKSSERLE